MSHDRCPRTEEIRCAVRRGVESDDIARHVATCPECADEALVGAFFVEVEKDPAAQRPLPDPALIWRRAARARRFEAAKRATRVITVWKWTAIACGVALALIGAFRYSGLLGNLLRGFDLPMSPISAASAGIGSGVVMMAIAGMLGVLVLIDHLVLAED